MTRARVLLLAAIVFFVGSLVYQQTTSRESTITRFHKLAYGDPGGWAGSRWMGVPTQQNPNDVWMHQEIIVEVRPDFIIEAGTLNGGSAILWAMILQEVNPEGRVITMDIEDNTAEARKWPIFQKKVDFFLGSSTDPAIVDEISRRVRGKRVLVILDSDHSKGHVLKEMESFAPLVNVGSYMIVQDTNLNGHPVAPQYGPGPWEALDEFLPKHPEFESDRSRERLLFTMHPRGYLKRVK